MPSFSLASSMIGRLVADWEISMSDFGDWCCEAGMGAFSVGVKVKPDNRIWRGEEIR
jgi:hypothetical protein